MLIKALLELCDVVVNLILNIFDTLPDFPEQARLAVDSFLELIFSNCSLISFFLPIDYCIIILGCSIAVMNFDKVFKVLMFVLKKIPMLGIE